MNFFRFMKEGERKIGNFFNVLQDEAMRFVNRLLENIAKCVNQQQEKNHGILLKKGVSKQISSKYVFGTACKS